MAEENVKDRLIKRFRGDGRIPYEQAEKKATEQLRRVENMAREGRISIPDHLRRGR